MNKPSEWTSPSKPSEWTAPKGISGSRPASGLLPAYLSLLAATFLWSSNVIAVKLAVRELPEIATAALRVTIAASTLATVYLLRGGRLRLRRSELREFLPLGLWGVALSFLFFTAGIAHTNVSHAVFVGALVPLAVLLLARWAGQERITPLKLTGIVLSLLGVLFLAFDQPGGAGPSWVGDLLVGGGVWCFAYFTVRSKKMAAMYESLETITHTFLVAAVCLTPVLLWGLAQIPWHETTGAAWGGLLYSATLGSAGAYLAYYFSLRFLEASRAAAFHYLQPVLATTFGVALFQEKLTVRFLLGAALILTGVFLAEHR